VPIEQWTRLSKLFDSIEQLAPLAALLEKKVSSKEAALMLCISETKVREMVRSGEMRAFCDDPIRVAESEVLRISTLCNYVQQKTKLVPQ
jgi:hypothetical protein